MPWKRNKDGNDKQQPAPQFQNITFTGVHNSSLAVGTGNTFIQNSTVSSQAGIAQLDAALASLRRLVESQAGALTAPAMEHVAALDTAAKKTPPDVGTVTQVRAWFTSNLPTIAPAVLDVIANPTVDTAVKAAAKIAHGAASAHSESPEHGAPAAEE